MSEPDFIKQFDTIARGANRRALVEEASQDLRAAGATWIEAEIAESFLGEMASITVRGWRERPALTAGEIKPEGE